MSSPYQKKYSAFISYRHVMPDMAIARTLARMLEHNMIRPNRGVKRNIRDVFVDVNELPLVESLDASIIHALENSEMLIVICSPDLPLSKYCMREISYFKELHGGRMDRIYTLLVRGDPMESFPEILRTETQVHVDENGVEQTVTVPVEPLFADVRANTLRQSLKKLRKTEYLRLAAAYYGCSYDDLYKRRQRWLWKTGLSIAGVTAAAALGFGVYAYARNLQYSAVKAATFASYAREQNEEGEELLAMTLCQEAWKEGVFSRSQRYMTALRSAAVQHDYKLKAAPFARMMTAEYMDSPNFNFYISDNEAVSIIQSQFIAQLTDTQTGQVLHNRPTDLFRVQTSDISWYMTINAQVDENGVLMDTLSLWTLEDHRLIKAIPLRPSGLTTPDYDLSVYMTQNLPQVLVITDHDEILIKVDKQGNPVSDDQFREMVILAAQEAPEEKPPYVVGQKKVLRKVTHTVSNAEGDVLLTLEGDVKHTAFSPDYTLFACLMDGNLDIYDTASWTKQASWPVAEENVGALHLLRDSTYVIVTYGTGAIINDYVLDWRTGARLGDFTGRVLMGQEHSFYTVYGGKLTRYHYIPYDLRNSPAIVAQHDSLLLTMQDDLVSLMDRDNGSILFQTERKTPVSGFNRLTLDYSSDLSRTLVRTAQGLCCYDQTGKFLWQTEPTMKPFALAKDGSLAAYTTEEGVVRVVSANDGALQYEISADDMAGIQFPDALAVSKDGLFLCKHAGQGESQALWLPADTRQAVELGHYEYATLYPDGMLVLEADTYVQDFALWNVKTRSFVLQPTDNTGNWEYSPVSGYLVRHLETSGNHGTLEVEVLRLNKNKIASRKRIALPDVSLTALHLDQTGKVLSLTAGDATFVYRLDDMTAILETTDCPLYYESGAFFSREMLGGELYTLPFLEGEALQAFAEQAITSPAGRRELSVSERSRYSFEE